MSYNARMCCDEMAAAFKALGDPTRLRIFEFLCVCAGRALVDETGAVRRSEGPTAGEVCCHVLGEDRVTSTISFHLKELRHVGLVDMEKRGRHKVCRVNREAVRRVARYLERAAEKER